MIWAPFRAAIHDPRQSGRGCRRAYRGICLGAVLALAAASTPAGAEEAAREAPTYTGAIRQVLDLHCTGCHSGKNEADLSVSGGLALDSIESILKSGAVVPGAAAKSEVIARLRETDDDLRMPKDAPPLAPDAVALLERWIDAGAPRGEAGPGSALEPRAVRLRPKKPLDLRIPVSLSLPKELARVPSDLPRSGLELRLRVAPLPPAAAVSFGPARKHGKESAEGVEAPDLLAVGGHGSAVVWDLSRGKPSRVIPLGEGPVHAVRFGPDGKRLALAGGRPGQAVTIIVVDVEGWRAARELRGHKDSVYDLVFSPDGRLLASASQDRTARVWDLASGAEVRLVKEHSDAVHGVAFLDGGKTLATGGADRAVKLTDLAEGKASRSFPGHDQPVLALAANPEGTALVSSGLEPGLRFWNLKDGRTLRTAGGHSGRVEEIAFARDGKTLVSAGSDRTARLWKAENGSQVKKLEAAEWLHSVDIDGPGRRVAAGSWDGRVCIWNAESGRLLATLLALPASGEEDLEWAGASANGWFRASERIWKEARIGPAQGAGPAPPLELLRLALDDAPALSKALQGDAGKPPEVAPEWEY